MKTSRALAIAFLGFGLGLGTGVIWMKDRQAVVVQELADLKTRRPMKAADRSTPAVTASVNAARKQQEAKQRKEQADAQARKEQADRVRALMDAALQLDDDRLRTRAIADIRKALESGDPAQVMLGLSAFNGLYELDFDKASFRNLILPHLEKADKFLRASAWSALMMSGLQEGDAARMRQVAKTMGLGPRTSYFLFRMEKGDLTGESGEIVRGLLDPQDPAGAREAMQGTWGSKYSPQLEADLIHLSRQPAFLHDTVYYALSTQQNKSAATVARLIEVLGDADSYNNGGRAAWGLGQGVSPELAPVVADAASKIVSNRTSGYLVDQAWGLLERYAGPGQLGAMQELAAKPNLSEDRRKRVDALIARLGAAEN
ncbi:MAG: hypothetical protein V4689_01995 [Verrucomicrobiota bacterium]